MLNLAERWTVKPEIKALVTWKQHNLLFPLKEDPFDCIFLKNVLIYFDTESKQSRGQERDRCPGKRRLSGRRADGRDLHDAEPAYQAEARGSINALLITGCRLALRLPMIADGEYKATGFWRQRCRTLTWRSFFRSILMRPMSISPRSMTALLRLEQDPTDAQGSSGSVPDVP